MRIHLWFIIDCRRIYLNIDTYIRLKFRILIRRYIKEDAIWFLKNELRIISRFSNYDKLDDNIYMKFKINFKQKNKFRVMEFTFSFFFFFFCIKLLSYFLFLLKLDDETLALYMEQLRRQLSRLERFRQVSFGPFSVARHQNDPQVSWFFRRRSLPSLTDTTPTTTITTTTTTTITSSTTQSNLYEQPTLRYSNQPQTLKLLFMIRHRSYKYCIPFQMHPWK